jgi:3-oxoacyl-[acyl-carrier protein] reductase
VSARRVLVTGASRGIGRAIALALARGGFDVALNYRSREKEAEAVSAELSALGRAAWLLPFDVADRAASAAALEADLKLHGPYYGVVHNAGVTADAAFPAMSGEAWDHVLRTNLDGFFHVVRPLVMPMVRARAGGRIVAISSTAGQAGNRGQVNYAASKAVDRRDEIARARVSAPITVNCGAGPDRDEIRRRRRSVTGRIRCIGSGAGRGGCWSRLLLSEGSSYVTDRSSASTAMREPARGRLPRQPARNALPPEPASGRRRHERDLGGPGHRSASSSLGGEEAGRRPQHRIGLDGVVADRIWRQLAPTQAWGQTDRFAGDEPAAGLEGLVRPAQGRPGAREVEYVDADHQLWPAGASPCTAQRSRRGR